MIFCLLKITGDLTFHRLKNCQENKLNDFLLAEDHWRFDIYFSEKSTLINYDEVKSINKISRYICEKSEGNINLFQAKINA